jgi:hypothetical protein
MFGCLTMLSISTLYNIDDKMINEFVEVGGMRIITKNQNYWRKPAQAPLRPPQFSPRSNPGYRGGKPEINHMNEST